MVEKFQTTHEYIKNVYRHSKGEDSLWEDNQRFIFILILITLFLILVLTPTQNLLIPIILLVLLLILILILILDPYRQTPVAACDHPVPNFDSYHDQALILNLILSHDTKTTCCSFIFILFFIMILILTAILILVHLDA